MEICDIRLLTASNRRLAADVFASLSPEQLASPSLCGAWTVQDIAGHLVLPFEVRRTSFVVELARHGGNLDRTFAALSRGLGSRPIGELVASLRRNADGRFEPPGVGPGGQLTDTCIHVRDVARPLGFDVSAPLQAWRGALEHCVGPRGRLGFVPRSRLEGLRLRATDQEWSFGEGAVVVGPSEAVVLALTGRTVALDDLDGPGVSLLRARLG